MINAKFRWDASIFTSKMGNLGTKLIPYAKVTFAQLADEARRRVKAYTPPTKGTNIRELWEIEHSSRGTIEEYIIHNLYENQDVILFFEVGTKPHQIRPRKAGYPLHWLDEDTGAHMFAYLVRHPGTPAYRMIEQGERETEVLLNQYIQQTLSMIGRGMS